jgi:hypothetical protein
MADRPSQGELGMEIRVSMRQLDVDRWVASSDGDLPLHVVGASRDDCIERLRRSLDPRMGSGEAVTLIVEVLPLVAGVAEAAGIMGWDKRRVVTYIDRGRFPEPIQALRSGRIWLRSDVERFAEEWRARQLQRKRLRERPADEPGQPAPEPL